MQNQSGSPLRSTPPADGQFGANATILEVFWRRKGLILFFLLCGLGGGYAFFTQQPESYRANAMVEVFSQKSNTNTGSAVEEVVDLVPSVAVIKAEVTSDEVLRSAIELGQLTSFDGMASDAGSMIGLLRQGLILEPGMENAEAKDRSIILVSYESGDALFSTAVVNSVVDAYEEYINGRHRKVIDGVVGFFRESKDSIIPKVDELETQYTAFRASAPLEWSANGEAVNPFREEAIRLEENVHGLESETRQINNKLKLIEESSKGKANAVAILQEVQYLINDVNEIKLLEDDLGPNSNVSMQSRLIALQIKSDLMATQFASNHPQRLAIDGELAATRRALEEADRTNQTKASPRLDPVARQEEAAKGVLQSYVSGMRKKRLLLEQETADLQTRLSEVRERAHKLIAFENENLSFQRRIGRFQEMLDSFDEQLEKANLPLLNPGLEVHVLQPAGIGYLVGPILAKMLVMGGFLGALLGAGLGWLLDWSERTFRSPDEIAQIIGVPILAHLPLIIPQKVRRSSKSTDDLEPIGSSVVTVHNPHSPCAEAIRQIRTGLFSTATKQAEYQVIQVTSAMPGDGKSTVLANLASSVAMANKRVLVIDADLRRPTQQTIFGIKSELGLTSVLNEECSLANAVQQTSVEGLYVLPSGPKPNNPSEALMLPEFGQLIDDLRDEFDLILIDTPPMLAVTDASNVANHVDGVMFVMRIGRNAKPMVKRAITMLKGLHVNVIGLIINAVGDSGYSSTYASAWSNSYGGQPGSEYGYAYYRYGSDKYLNASKGQSVTVKGRNDVGKNGKKLATVSVGPDEDE